MSFFQFSGTLSVKGNDKKQDGVLPEDESSDDEEALTAAMGIDPTIDPKIRVPLTKSLTTRWTHWVRQGISSDRLSVLTGQYIVPEFLKVPQLNLEIKGYVKQNVLSRDGRLQDEQLLISCSLISMAGSMYTLMREEGCKKLDEFIQKNLIQMNTESVELQAQLFFEKTLTRKSFIIRSVQNTSIQEILKEQQTDKFLFGEDLSEKLKALKYVQKTSRDMADTGNIRKVDHFLEQRASHPARNNQYWQGQDSQQDRWSFNKNRLSFPTNNYQAKPFNGHHRGRGAHTPGSKCELCWGEIKVLFKKLAIYH